MTRQVVVSGKAYPVEPIQALTTGALRFAKRVFGLTLTQVRQYLNDMSEEADFADVLGDDEMRCWIMMWMISAGDHITPEEFDQIPIDDITPTVSDAGLLGHQVPELEEDSPGGESGEPPDPTTASARTGTAPTAGARSKANGKSSRRGSSKTSSGRSGTGSR